MVSSWDQWKILRTQTCLFKPPYHVHQPKQDYKQNECTYECMTYLYLPCYISAPMTLMHKHVNAC